MYELVCPHCEHVERSPFVRVGAVVVCKGCGKKFQIEANHIRRKVVMAVVKGDDPLIGEAMPPPFGVSTPSPTPAPAKAAKPSPSPSAAAAPPAAPEQSQPRASAAAEPASTATALAQAVASHDEPQDAAAIAAAVEPAARHRPSSDTAGGRTDARHLARLMAKRRKRTTMLWLSSGMSVILIAVAVGLWVKFGNPAATFNGNNGGNTANGNNGNSAGGTDVATTNNTNPNPGPGDQSNPPGTGASTTQNPPVSPVKPPGVTPLVQGEPMVPTPWLKVDELFNPSAESAAGIQQQAFRPEPQPSQNTTYQAEIALTPDAPLALGAIVHLALVNSQNHVFARAHVPLALVDARRPQSISLAIPNELVEQAERLHGTIEVTRKLDNAMFFRDVRTEPKQADGQTVVHVSAFNDVPNPMQQVVFLLEARDAQGRVLGRWRVDWTAAVDAMQTVEFDAVVAVEAPLAAAISQWSVIGAGQPMTAP